jgi:hypothetical protein
MHLMKLPACLFPFLYLSVQATQAISPGKTIRPFESGDLSMFETWQKETGHEDPDNVFSLKDGVLRVSGHGSGYIATKQSYKDYDLKVEYKWGKKTDGGKYVRNSGVLLHGNCPHGAARGVWMSSLEVQLAQGCEGDFIVIRGNEGPKVDITCKTRIAEDKRTRWDPDGKPTRYSGRQFWWSNHQPFFKELLDTRGKDDVASPLGEWTKVECISKGDLVSVFINGVKVNEAYNVFPQSGKILLQNESHEVFFRNFEINPVSKSK